VRVLAHLFERLGVQGGGTPPLQKAKAALPEKRGFA